ncbi:PadR family transcriptional regulator [Virgibacillus alimentarius]|uniref:DNA-binding PadR family transcriptional regulator n=1 Tax=Virgibacillus alimentarius TaxID=698769 RepID=A0ABS4S7M9_9BACI|nr:PadR family transcriptional regulator [Virgibacillus alimentarius]MBP2257503.1 DNA-binding PadR family transcriptional regulator [Virgibacillus alimentarius]
MKYNHTTYAILGILTTGCRTGYAIKQLMDQSLNHFWKISYGQIYPTLKQIVKEGLATVDTLSEEGKPSRKEYYLTTKGKQTLKDWLQKPVEQVPVEKNEILLKLFFSRHQSNTNALSLINNYREKLEENYQTYQNIEQMIANQQQNQADAKYWLFTLDYGKRVTKAAIEWCHATTTQMNKG